MTGFLPLYGIRLEGYAGPAFLRYVLWPFDKIPFTSGTATFPCTSLYGGPTTAAALSSPQGQAFIRAMQAWAAAYGFIGYPEIIPIALEQYGHRWPRKTWAWETRREVAPPARYTLSGVPPILIWKAVA